MLPVLTCCWLFGLIISLFVRFLAHLPKSRAFVPDLSLLLAGLLSVVVGAFVFVACDHGLDEDLNEHLVNKWSFYILIAQTISNIPIQIFFASYLWFKLASRPVTRGVRRIIILVPTFTVLVGIATVTAVVVACYPYGDNVFGYSSGMYTWKTTGFVGSMVIGWSVCTMLGYLLYLILPFMANPRAPNNVFQSEVPRYSWYLCAAIFAIFPRAFGCMFISCWAYRHHRVAFNHWIVCQYMESFIIVFFMAVSVFKNSLITEINTTRMLRILNGIHSIRLACNKVRAGFNSMIERILAPHLRAQVLPVANHPGHSNVPAEEFAFLKQANSMAGNTNVSIQGGASNAVEVADIPNDGMTVTQDFHVSSRKKADGEDGSVHTITRGCSKSHRASGTYS